MRFMLHFDNQTERLTSFVIESTSRDPQQAHAELRAGVAAASAAFSREHGAPFMRGRIAWRCEWLGD
jgi:hypothetical protein